MFPSSRWVKILRQPNSLPNKRLADFPKQSLGEDSQATEFVTKPRLADFPKQSLGQDSQATEFITKSKGADFPKQSLGEDSHAAEFITKSKVADFTSESWVKTQCSNRIHNEIKTAA